MSTRRWLLLVMVATCGPTQDVDVGDEPWAPPPEQCQVAPTAGSFVDCTLGSGAFGQWVLDGEGLPAYDYHLDQHADARAAYFNTGGLDRRDHWAAFGNHRLNVLASNDGTLEVYTQDRGVTSLNALDERRLNFVGGFSEVSDGTEAWSTAYRWRPTTSRTHRRFGIGWAESSLQYRGLQVTRVTAAPEGLHPVVLTEVTVRNLSARRRVIRHDEYWDVARRNIEINWLVSGNPFTSLPEDARLARDSHNTRFLEQLRYRPEQQLLQLQRAHAADVTAPAPAAIDDADWYPGHPFLACLRGAVSDVYGDQRSYFGAGGPAAPRALVDGAPGLGLEAGARGAPASGAGQPRALVLSSELTLEPWASQTLRFAYGYAPWAEQPTLPMEWLAPDFDVRAAATTTLRERLLLLATPAAPALHRELAWHSAQLEASVGLREHQGQRVVPQGSAYLYLHGADGAARDLGLFALPLVFTNPALARDELTFYMQTQRGDGSFSYAFHGHGRLDDALGLHRAPSDLDLFFLWALTEYLGATGDLGLLDAAAPFHPRQALSAATGRDHLLASVRHLLDAVGEGPHGLLRLQTGDWSDGVVTRAPDRALAIAHGESVPNTQMALAVLPRVAQLLDREEPALAAEVRRRLPRWCEAVKQTWVGRHFGRAYFGDGVLVGADAVDLEAQVWALIGDCFVSPADRQTLVDTVRLQLDEPSPIGATLTPRGQVWPAISALLTWGYARSAPQLALGHLARNTLAARAVAFPDKWAGVWSGPDGVFAFDEPGASEGRAPRAGEAWFSPATPMSDFPVQNNNQHAMPLFAALKVVGVEVRDDGLQLAPLTADARFSLKTRLLELEVSPGLLSGRYRPGRARTLTVAAPPGQVLRALSVSGAAVALPAGARSASVAVDAGGATFEASTGP